MFSVYKLDKDQRAKERLLAQEKVLTAQNDERRRSK